MQQFRPLSSPPNEVDVADVEMPITSTTGNLYEGQPAPQPVLTGPLFFLTNATQERRTDELGAVSGPLFQEAGTLSLLTALQSTMTPSTAERIVVIPGSRKRAKKSAAAAPSARWRRISLRLRHGLVLAFVFFMLVTTLLSLSPLAAE